MRRSTAQRRSTWVILLALTVGSGLGACQSGAAGGRDQGLPGDDGVTAPPSVCPSCEPIAGGETGDFAGTPTACAGISSAVEIDAATAAALGFDVAELERRALRPIELPMRWRAPFASLPPPFSAVAERAGAPATGYEEYTQISARLSSTGVFHHMRPDPALCEGHDCRLPGLVGRQQAPCPDYLQLGVTAEVHTQDGALQAVTEGVATQGRSAPDDTSFNPQSAFMFVTHGDLSKVTGTLVLSPRPGALRYVGLLHFSCYLSSDSCEGELSPSVMIYASESGGLQYSPLYGSFPPVDESDAGVGGAGMSR